MFKGLVEIDETYIGGKRENMSKAKRRELEGAGWGSVGKTAVLGAKYRETNQVDDKGVLSTDAPTLKGFVEGVTDKGVKVCSDEAAAYKGIDRDHECVNHSVGEYVREMAHANGMESFWSRLKRGYQGVYH